MVVVVMGLTGPVVLRLQHPAEHSKHMDTSAVMVGGWVGELVHRFDHARKVLHRHRLDPIGCK